MSSQAHVRALLGPGYTEALWAEICRDMPHRFDDSGARRVRDTQRGLGDEPVEWDAFAIVLDGAMEAGQELILYPPNTATFEPFGGARWRVALADIVVQEPTVWKPREVSFMSVGGDDAYISVGRSARVQQRIKTGKVTLRMDNPPDFDEGEIVTNKGNWLCRFLDVQRLWGLDAIEEGWVNVGYTFPVFTRYDLRADSP